jgi:hypothetical protein
MPVVRETDSGINLLLGCYECSNGMKKLES